MLIWLIMALSLDKYICSQQQLRRLHLDSSRNTQVEEVENEDEDDVGRYTEEYPGHIATTLGMDKTKCKKIQDGQMMEGLEPHAPFTNEDEWELVKWLMKNVGQIKADNFLKMHIVRF